MIVVVSGLVYLFLAKEQQNRLAYRYENSALKVGLIGLDGKVILEPTFSRITNFNNGYALANAWRLSTIVSQKAEDENSCNWHDCVTDDLIIRKNGSIVKQIRETSLKSRLLSNAIYPFRAVETPGGCNIVGQDGQRVAGPFDRCLAMSGDLLIVQKDALSFLLIPGFSVRPLPGVIAANSGSSNKIISVCKKSGWGAVDRSGKFVVPPKYLAVENEKYGFVPVKVKDTEDGVQVWQLLDLRGLPKIKETFSRIDSIQPGSISVAVMKSGEQQMGIIDMKGEWNLPPSHDAVELVDKNLAIVRSPGNIERIYNLKLKSFSKPFKALKYLGSSLFAFKTSLGKESKFGLLNADGFIEKSPIFSDITPSRINSHESNNYPASILVDGKNRWGWIDGQGNWLINPQFDEAGTFAEGVAYFAVKPSLSNHK